MGGRKKGTRAGFTAMELIITLIIIFILAGISVPFILGALQSYRLRAAAWQIAGDLRLARQKAVSTQKNHRVCFQDCGSGITVPSNGYVIQREDPPWVLDSQGLSLPPGVTLSQNASYGKITFNPKGTVNAATVTLRNASGQYEVVIATSGRVKVCKGTCP